MANKAGHRQFGSIRQRASGRFQVRYPGPDGKQYTAKKDGDSITFDTLEDARAWLNRCKQLIAHGEWNAEGRATPLPQTEPGGKTLRKYADAWVAGRDLADRTREHYEQLLEDHVYPTFGNVPVPAIKAAEVRAWHSSLSKKTGPTARAHAYGLLRTIMHSAVADDLVSANPCRVRAGGQSKRAVRIKPATLAELEIIANSVPEKYQLMILLASWCALRQGELFELRRSDVDTMSGVVHVQRGVVRTKDGRKVKDPKSDAGKRPVALPPHLVPVVEDHLREHAAPGKDGLLFPARTHGEQLAPSTLYKVYYPAREAAGRPDLRFHDLRHTGAVLAASTGATLAELMARLGHSTTAAAMRYQHASQDRDRVIAEALSKLAAGNVTPITEAKSKRDAGKATG